MATNRRILTMSGGRIVHEIYGRGVSGDNIGRVGGGGTASCCICCPPLSAACRDSHLWTETAGPDYCAHTQALGDGCAPYRPKGYLVTISGAAVGQATSCVVFPACGVSPATDFGTGYHCYPTFHPVGNDPCWRWCASGHTFSGTFLLRPGAIGSADECKYVYEDPSYTGTTFTYGCCGEGGATMAMKLRVEWDCGGVSAILSRTGVSTVDKIYVFSGGGQSCCCQTHTGGGASTNDVNCPHGWGGGTVTSEPYCDD